MANTDLAERIRNHPNVRMIEVDETNRDELVSIVLGLMAQDLINLQDPSVSTATF